jgi:hypothetical protein
MADNIIIIIIQIIITTTQMVMIVVYFGDEDCPLDSVDVVVSVCAVLLAVVIVLGELVLLILCRIPCLLVVFVCAVILAVVIVPVELPCFLVVSGLFNVSHVMFGLQDKVIGILGAKNIYDLLYNYCN